MVGTLLIPLSFKDVHEANWVNGAEPHTGALLQSVVILAMTVVALTVAARIQSRWKTTGNLLQSLMDMGRREYVPAGVTLLMASLSLCISLIKSNRLSSSSVHGDGVPNVIALHRRLIDRSMQC